MKKVFEGWMSEANDPFNWVNYGLHSEELYLSGFFKEKGSRRDWLECEWPPNHVRLTVEVIE